MFLHADSEDSDQTGQMPRLIRVFAGRTGHFVGFIMLQLLYFVFFPESAWNRRDTSTDPHTGLQMSREEKHIARPGLENRTSRTLCEHSDH